MIGPNYECCESNDLDTESIYLTRERLEQTIEVINGMNPQPAFVIVLGDVFHESYHSTNPDWYLENESAMAIAAELLEGIDAPVYPLWGNHDYEVPYVDRAFSHGLFGHFFGVQPYYAIEHGAWKFVLANSQLGPTWDPGNEMYDRSVASFGDEQLLWIADQLGEGMPSFLMFHYGLLGVPELTKRGENPGGVFEDIFEVIATHESRVKMILAGHTHRWIDAKILTPELLLTDVPHYIVAATRYDPDNFWVVEFESGTDHFEILDYDKVDWVLGSPYGGLESATWDYTDGVPHP